MRSVQLNCSHSAIYFHGPRARTGRGHGLAWELAYGDDLYIELLVIDRDPVRSWDFLYIISEVWLP